MIQFRVLHYDTLDSTNRAASELASQGIQEGAVVFADYQTRGKGRFRRRWYSPKGKDLLFSIIIRPPLKNNQTPIITQLAAKGVCGILKKVYDLPAAIKRPNDVLVDGKKICGILTESNSSPSSEFPDYVIVGIGLNVNSKKKELLRTATSIYELKGKVVDRQKLIRLVLNEFRHQYLDYLKEHRFAKGGLKHG